MIVSFHVQLNLNLSTEPEDFCRSCDNFFPLSVLHKNSMTASELWI